MSGSGRCSWLPTKAASGAKTQLLVTGYDVGSLSVGDGHVFGM